MAESEKFDIQTADLRSKHLKISNGCTDGDISLKGQDAPNANDPKNEIDLSHSDDETLVVDDLGIHCKLNFNGPDRKETRKYIRKCRDRAFFGKKEYEDRVHQSTELLNLSQRQ